MMPMLLVSFTYCAAMVELVDTQDSKFCVRKNVPVQVRLAVPRIENILAGSFEEASYLFAVN